MSITANHSQATVSPRFNNGFYIAAILLSSLLGIGFGMEIASRLGLDLSNPLILGVASGLAFVTGILVSILAVPPGPGTRLAIVATGTAGAAVSSIPIAYGRGSIASIVAGVVLFALIQSLGVMSVRNGFLAA